MAKIKKAEAKVEKKKTEFMTVWAGIWIVAMTAIFPIYFQDAYADILTAKYGFMLVADIIFLVGFIIWALIAGRPKKYIVGMKSHADAETGKWFCGWFKDAFNWIDIFVLAFLIITVISLLCASPYVYQAFFGNEGRWMGALTLMLLCFTFFVASRYFKFSKGFITAFLIGTLITTVWSITDYFDMDILKFKYGMSTNYYRIFTSSFGNIDTYCGYAAIPMAFAGIIFIFSKESVGRLIFYWVCYAAAILSMITSSADNAYLAIAVFFAFAPLAATKTRSGIRRYLLTLATFVSAIAIVEYWDKIYADFVIIPEGVITYLEGVDQIKYIAVALWIIVIAFYVFDFLIKKIDISTPAPKWIHIVWTILLCVAIVVIIVLFALANQPTPYVPSALEPIGKYLVFSDSWGTWRGYVWKRLLEIYGGLPFINKLFGAGPETAGIYMFNEAYWDIAGTTGMLFDTPHNEWLCMLFNIGPLGLISYLGTMIAPAVMAFRRSTKKYYHIVMAVSFVCICHLAESFVNIFVPMELPIIFALMAMAQSLFRIKE